MSPLKALAVVGLGCVDVGYGIPLGFAFGLDMVTIAVAAAIGSILSAAVTLFVGRRVGEWMGRHNLRARLMARLGRRRIGERAGPAERHPRAYRVWQRFGVAGLGIAAPVLVGSVPGVIVGMAFGARRLPLLAWTAVGVAITSAVITLALGGVLHVAGLRAFT